MKSKQENNLPSENTEEKNPYQAVMDLPDNEIMDFAEGIEMVRKAAIWILNNGKEPT